MPALEPGTAVTMMTKATGAKRTVQMRLQSLGRLEPGAWEVESGPHTRAGGLQPERPWAGGQVAHSSRFLHLQTTQE